MAEVVDPIVLSTGVYEKVSCPACCSCCCCGDIPEIVTSNLSGCLCDEGGERFLLVCFGIFSVVRIVRPAQYLISATEYCVPDKECVAPSEDDPCRIFNTMAFPINEFCPPEYVHTNKPLEKHCGCQ